MSIYVMNKLMRAIEMSDAAVQEYVADPRAYVSAWICGASPIARWADDRELADEEREAFANRDYEALYRLGAHPYLLWHFTEAIYIHEVKWPALVEQYREAVSRHTPPDLTA
jgi:pyrroloquinoline quinone (PQQ) biosynthesis protein C